MLSIYIYTYIVIGLAVLVLAAATRIHFYGNRPGMKFLMRCTSDVMQKPSRKSRAYIYTTRDFRPLFVCVEKAVSMVAQTERIYRPTYTVYTQAYYDVMRTAANAGGEYRRHRSASGHFISQRLTWSLIQFAILTYVFDGPAGIERVRPRAPSIYRPRYVAVVPRRLAQYEYTRAPGDVHSHALASLSSRC